MMMDDLMELHECVILAVAILNHMGDVQIPMRTITILMHHGMLQIVPILVGTEPLIPEKPVTIIIPQMAMDAMQVVRSK